MIREYVAQTGPEIELDSKRKMQLDWGFILTILAVASVFLGNALIRIDLGIFQLYPLRLFGIVGIVFMILQHNWQDPFLPTISRFIFFFLLLGFGSIFWAPDTTLAIKEFGILQTGLTLTWLILRYVNTEKRLELVLLIWICGAIFLNLIGLWEVINQKYLIMTNVSDKMIRSFDRIGGWAPRSIFANQNNFGFFNALTALVLFGMLVKKTRPMWHYLLNGFSLALSVYLLICTYSRAAMGSFVLGLAFFLIFTFFSKSKHKLNVIKLLLIGATALAVIIVVNTTLLDSFYDKLYLVIEKNNQKQGGDGRTNIYAQNLAYVVENLGIGMGPGSSYDNLDTIPPHNFFLQILVEYGVVTVLGLLWILYRVFKRLGLYKHVMTDAVSYSLRASILAFPLMSIGPSTILVEGVFWLWFGFIIAYSSVMLRKYCATLPAADIN